MKYAIITNLAREPQSESLFYDKDAFKSEKSLFCWQSQVCYNKNPFVWFNF